MSPTTRRSFLKTGLVAGDMATVGTIPLAAKRTATDTVVLGRAKMQATRLAFGRLQEHAGDRRGHQKHESGLGIAPGPKVREATAEGAASSAY